MYQFYLFFHMNAIEIVVNQFVVVSLAVWLVKFPIDFMSIGMTIALS